MTKEKETPIKRSVQYLTITPDDEGRRIDNYVLNLFKNIPKSHVYKILRKGEIRVNKKRIDASYKLKVDDVVRLPPVYQEANTPKLTPKEHTLDFLRNRILLEDENLIILNKPSGIPVHAGSTVKVGVIEAMRHLYPKLKNLELCHRLDSETSGCLILAKKKRVLREIHQMLRDGLVEKIYQALTRGQWKKSELTVALPLHKSFHEGGKHVVTVNKEGKSALTVFKTIKAYKIASLMEVFLATGRTHQIRVHAETMGHPIAMDDRYGDPDFNKRMRDLGLSRLFLHAQRINFTLPSTKQHIRVEAPLDLELVKVLKNLERSND